MEGAKSVHVDRESTIKPTLWTVDLDHRYPTLVRKVSSKKARKEAVAEYYNKYWRVNTG